MTVACVEALRRKVTSPDPIVRFFVDGVARPLNAQIQRLLPRQSDGSFEGYHRRITRGSQDVQYALMLGDIHAWDRRFFGDLCRGMDRLFRRFGIPAWMVDTQLLVGSCSTTPFGVHIDPATVFYFPVIGPKVIRLWRRGYVERAADLKRAHHYERHLDASTLIETGPGGMLYWPSDRWHIAEAEADGSLSVAWGLGYYFGAGLQSLGERLDTPIADKTHVAYPWPPRGLASAIGASARAAGDAGKRNASGRARQDERRTLFGRHVTAYAFRSLPPPVPCGPLPSVVRARPGHPLASFRLENGERRVVSMGRFRDFDDSETLRTVLRLLATGRAQRVEGLLGRAGGPRGRRQVQMLLRFALEHGSLERGPS